MICKFLKKMWYVRKHSTSGKIVGLKPIPRTATACIGPIPAFVVVPNAYTHTYMAEIEVDGRRKKMEISEELYHLLAVGDAVNVEIQRGFFGSVRILSVSKIPVA